jgi:hypothetical protein
MEERPSWETITIYFDGKPLQVTSGISIKEALQLSGFSISPFPKGDEILDPAVFLSGGQVQIADGGHDIWSDLLVC